MYVMIDKMFDNRNPFWRFLAKLFNVLLLNLCWIVCSIPFVTVGISVTAVYAGCFGQILESDQGPIKTFLRSFKLNWRQATAVLFATTLPAALLLFDLWYFFAAQTWMTGAAKYAVCVFLSLLVIVVFLVQIYGFALLSLFENTVKGTLQNALILALRHPGRSLSMLVLDLGLCFGTVWSIYCFPILSMLLLLFGVGLILFLNALILLPILRRFLPNGGEISSEPEIYD